MKRNISIIVPFVLFSFIIFISCNKEENNVNQESNDVLKRYLEIKSTMSSFQQKNGENNLEAMGASILNKRNKSLKDGIDSAVVDTGYWQFWTCATVSEYVDNDGNNVTVYDYGENGCDEWGSLIKGKITYIWSQNADTYFSKVIYENYSAYGMTMNGYSEYSYTFDDMIIEGNGDSTTYTINWSGSSSCIEDIEMLSDNGETFLYTGNYSSAWDEKSFTVHEGEYSYKNITKGYEFTYRVTQELYYNYECSWEIYVPTRGVEQIIYKDAGVNDEFVTDYGEGTCDNLATITENGVTYTVDFGEMWYYSPCEGENCDSVVVNVGNK
jgi:hypothetical protein